MQTPTTGWKNKTGTADHNCAPCGSWKLHWTKFSKQTWPMKCSVAGCSSTADVGAHIFHPQIEGGSIVPMCYACNKSNFPFALRIPTVLAPARSCP